MLFLEKWSGSFSLAMKMVMLYSHTSLLWRTEIISTCTTNIHHDQKLVRWHDPKLNPHSPQLHVNLCSMRSSPCGHHCLTLLLRKHNPGIRNNEDSQFLTNFKRKKNICTLKWRAFILFFLDAKSLIIRYTNSKNRPANAKACPNYLQYTEF